MKGVRNVGTKTARGIALCAVALVIAVALAACGSSSSSSTSSSGSSGASTASAGTPVSGGTLVIGRSFEALDLNPFTCACENGSLQVLANVFDNLVHFAPNSTGAPGPGLATSWTISPDQLTYTFKLRAAHFSNGEPVTASDVKYSLTRASGPKSLYGVLYPIKSADVLSPTTVALHLKHVTPALLYSLAIPPGAIAPEKVASKESDATFANHPVGAGPFMLKEWLKGQKVVLVPNPHYWGKKPYLEQVVFQYVPDDNTRSLDVQSGNIDIGDEIPYSQIGQINGQGQAKVKVFPSSALDAVYLNNAVKPLNDTKVRLALNYATPVAAIRKSVFMNLAPIGNSTAPKLKYWSSSVPPFPYDIAKAKALLAESSAPKGFTLTLNIDGTDEPSVQTAQILQQSYAQIGVKVKVQQLDFGTLQTRRVAGQDMAYLLIPDANTSDIPVPDEFAYFLYASQSADQNLYSNYVNPQAQKLTEEATSTSDETKRAQLFAQLQQVTMTNPPSVPIVFAPYRTAIRSNVQGFNYLLTGFYYLGEVWKSH
jgi:peptide/nickel transport system substrate-binding protein